MKTCNRCGESKNEVDFCKEPRNKSGVGGECKSCMKGRTKDWRHQNPNYYSEYYSKNKDTLSRARKDFYQENKESELERNKEWRNNNQLKLRVAKKTYQIKNPHVGRLCSANRRASELNATPSWLSEKDSEKIKFIYETCPHGHEVDHIIPLQGKEVCGLHVPWNLQHLKIHENREKSNSLFEIIG